MGPPMLGELEKRLRDAELKWLETWTRGPVDVALPPQIQVGSAAPDLDLETLSGSWEPLSAHWEETPCVLVFLRHFGCPATLRRLERLDDEIPGMRDCGIRILLVCQADPIRARSFFEGYQLDAAVLCDSSLNAYSAYGLREGTVSEVLFDAPRSDRAHSRETGRRMMKESREEGRRLVDNHWLLPGEFVIAPDGTVCLAYRYQHIADFPDSRLIQATVAEIMGSSGND